MGGEEANLAGATTATSAATRRSRLCTRGTVAARLLRPHHALLRRRPACAKGRGPNHENRNKVLVILPFS